MFSILLALIYLAFISLGLPDSLIGSAWPVMHNTLGVPLSYAGIVTMIIAGGTILSSLASDRLNKKFGTGLVTAVSVLLTALALFGFSFSNTFWMVCAWSIPYGLGAGAIDAALNNYVALHYSSRHMSWLHCFWGVGASISPYIMSYCLTGGLGWANGYRFVGIIQISLTAILFFTLPLWKRNQKATGETEEQVSVKPLSIRKAVRIKGVVLVLITFFAYCSMETTTGLWASSYLVHHRGIDAETAAQFASLFYLGITLGRFLSGFIANKFGDRLLIRIGSGIIVIGILFVLLPVETQILSLAGLVIIGFGCAPVYPSIIHSTPSNFGKENSQAIIGIQMASAYAGSTFMPPIFGWLSSLVGIWLYPFYLLFFVVLMIIMNEVLNKRVDQLK